MAPLCPFQNEHLKEKTRSLVQKQAGQGRIPNTLWGTMWSSLAANCFALGHFLPHDLV
jgi:hypothetical protein